MRFAGVTFASIRFGNKVYKYDVKNDRIHCIFAVDAVVFGV